MIHHDLCFGCRATEGAPISQSDRLMALTAMPGFDPSEWERFECARCGVKDVRLIREQEGQ